LVYFDIQMINTPYQYRFSELEDYEETEAELQKIYPGLRLIRYSWDIATHQWIYRLCFEQEKDYTWFMLKSR
jgi:hypothetical protein